MRDDKLSIQSMHFAVSIINLVKELKLKKENIISNQIGRSGTSIGANIREAQYAHGKADFVQRAIENISGDQKYNYFSLQSLLYV